MYPCPRVFPRSSSRESFGARTLLLCTVRADLCNDFGLSRNSFICTNRPGNMRLGTLTIMSLFLASRVSAQDSAPADPWPDRPSCQSSFLKSDWELTRKQRACEWLINGVFSVGGIVGSNIGAITSVAGGRNAESGDPYLERFGRRVAENTFKTTGAYLGAWITGEDPRRRPPYVVLKGHRPTGLIARTGIALRESLMAYRCDSPCANSSHVRSDRIAAARIVGSLASGVGEELMIHHGQISPRRVARASLLDYVLGFGNSVVGEFTPELTAAVAQAVKTLFGSL